MVSRVSKFNVAIWLRSLILLIFIYPSGLFNIGGVSVTHASMDRYESRANTGFAQQTEPCVAEFISISKPLNDLGNGEYIRPNTGPTGLIGGLYPNGSNTPPPAHQAAGLRLAAQIVPRNGEGNPDPNGKIVLLSIGMSNTAGEFGRFEVAAGRDDSLNPNLVIANGAQGGRVATYWLDPQAEAWQFVDDLLAFKEVTPLQVQAAWVKVTNYDLDDFPQDIQTLQSHEEIIARNLKSRFPNLKIAYYSSRTRSYAYWTGPNPEPYAFETGFSVRWMIEKQINGDPSLNYDPGSGPVMAPYLIWGPYLWIDGLNPRSDGRIWEPADLKRDCVHPSDSSGKPKVVEQLMQFFKTDPTARNWFLADPPPMEKLFLPSVRGDEELRFQRIWRWRISAR